MFNEISHLKLGFASFASHVTPGYNSEWYAHELRVNSFTFAKIANGANGDWKLQASTVSAIENNWLAYRKGNVFEVEMGTRLLLGRQVQAERYLDYYAALPTIDLNQLSTTSLRGTMVLRHVKSAVDENYPGVQFVSTGKFEDDGIEKIRVVLELNSAQNAAYFITKWADDKQIELIRTGNCPLESGVKADQQAPIFQETLSLF